MFDPPHLTGAKISIHALPAEGDFTAIFTAVFCFDISIHALPAEGD